jgi:hypothetical protein
VRFNVLAVHTAVILKQFQTVLESKTILLVFIPPQLKKFSLSPLTERYFEKISKTDITVEGFKK